MDFLNLNVSVNILSLDRIAVGRNWNWKNINSPFSRLYYILDGSAKIRIENVVYDLIPGKMCLVPCFANHDYYCDNYMEHYFVHFTSRISKSLDILNIQDCPKLLDGSKQHLDYFRELTSLNPDRKLLDLTPSVNPLLEPDSEQSEYHQVISRTNNPGEYFAKVFRSQGILRMLISAFLEQSSLSDTKIKMAGYNRFNKVIQYIDLHLNYKLSLEDLASLVNLNPTYFSNKFYELIGERPIAYINRKRIEKAQTLLLFSNTPIKEIAMEVGFEDVNYFSRMFSKFTNMPPNKYRTRHKNM